MSLNKSSLLKAVNRVVLFLVTGALLVTGVTPAQANTATALFMNFEAADPLKSLSANPALGPFGGASSEIKASTRLSGNSLHFTKTAGSQVWAGNNLLLSNSTVYRYTDANNKVITVDYWSNDTAPSPVMMKVEGQGAALKTLEAQPGLNKLSFDMSTGTGWNANSVYTMVIIFPNFGADDQTYKGAGPVPNTGQVYEIDNVSINGGTEANLYVPPVAGKEATSTLVTFEANDARGAKVVGGAAADKLEGSFEGAVTTIEDAPAGGNGGKALKIVKSGQPWSGATILNFPTATRITNNTHKTVTFNYFSPKADSPVRVELVPFPRALGKTVTVPQGWSRVVVDFSDVSGWSGTEEYTNLAIFPDFQVAPAATPLEFFVDNVGINGATTPAIRSTPQVLVNFESNDTSGYALTDFGGNQSSVVTDAPADGSAGSTKALRIAFAGGQPWAGTTFLSRADGQSLISAGNFVVKANIYSPVAGKRLNLKLENVAAPAQSIEKEANSTSVVGWRTYTFDFTVGGSLAIDYNRASIFVDFQGNPKSTEPFFVDDIAFNGAKGADLGGAVVEPPVVVPPFTGNAIVRLVGMDDTNSFNRPADAAFFSVANPWYRVGINVRTKQVPVGSTQTLTYLATNAADNTPLAGQTVTLTMGKEFSGSNAKVNVGSVAAVGTQNKTVTGVTNAEGLVTFSMVNTDIAADAADFPGTNLGVDFKGKKLFTQVSAWISSQTKDSIDLVDFVFFRPSTFVPARNATSTLLTFEAGDTRGASVVGGAAAPKIEGSFEGSVTTIEDAPAGGNGGKALKIVKSGQPWAGANMLSFGADIRITNATHKTVTFNYFSPKANSPVRVELNPGAIGTSVTVPQGWSRVSVDFTNVAGWSATTEYTVLALFPDFQVAASNPPAEFFVDNFGINGATTPAIRTAPQVLVNFEDNDNSGFTLTSFDGNQASVVTDAPANGSVGSKKALRIVFGGGQPWAGTTFLTRAEGVSLISTGNFVVKANIFSPVAGKDIRLKLENAAAPAQAVEKNANTKSVVGWSTYSFDFSVGGSPAIDYNRATIFLDFMGNPKNTEAWFVDDIAFNGAKGADIDSGSVVVPPFTGNANVRLVGMDDTNSFNRPDDAAFFSVANPWYRTGLTVRTKQVPVGSTQTLTYLVTNAVGGAPLAGQTVTLTFGKEFSGSTAKVNVGSVAAVGTQNKTVTGVTDSEGRVTFTMVNTDVAADAANFPANLGADFTGKKLFTQVSAWVTSQTQDSIDLVDFIFFRPESYVPAREATSTLLTFEAGDTRGASVVGAAAGAKIEGSFEGSVTTIEDAPAGGNGGKALKIVKSGQPWAGANILSFASGVRVTNAANKEVTFNYFSPKANSPLRVELGPGAVGKTVTVPQGWSKVVVDFSDVAAWSATTEYNLVAIFPDFLVAPAATPLEFFVDNFGINGAKTPDITVPATIYNARLADWNASNSFDGTKIWGGPGIGQGWFDVHTGYFAKYVAAGSTFELRYRVTNAATGANAPDGTVVTLSLGAAWSNSNAKFAAGNTVVDGVTKWGGNGQEDMATVTATVTNGFATVSLKSNDTVADASANPGHATANPDGLNPRFMQVKIKVEGNVVTRQDWVNIIATKPSAAPTVTSVSARNARAGQAVDIVGTNLGDALTHSAALVSPATAKTSEISTPVRVLFVSADRTRMTVLSPELTQKGTFVVTNTGGSASSTAFAASVTTTARPTISMPASLVREIGSTITLTGNNLASVSSVTIGEVAAPFRIVNATSIVVTVPAGVQSGSKISATNAGGTTTTSKFIYQAAVIENATDAAKVGETVTLTGSSLKVRSIVFGGNKAAKPVINENGLVTVIVPTGALSGAIKITTSAGTYFTKGFTVTPPTPTVSSFTPSGKKGVTVVTVRGTALKGATVTVGTTTVTLLPGANSTSLKFVIPADATSGKITVTTPGGTVESATSLTVN